MYKPEIFDGIINILIKSQMENSSLTYTTLYKKLAVRLDRKLSHRDYTSHLTKMIEEKIIYKQEIEGKKLSQYYVLTESARKQYQLRIMRSGEEYEKRLSLYHLLIYFETFKRGQILNDNQLDKLLTKIGTSRDKLTKIEGAYEEPISDIEIVPLSSKRFANSSRKLMYYVLMRGLSIREFVSYIRKLRNNKEPKPFSRYAAIVPFVRVIKYTPKEVEDAINLLHKDGLLSQITFTVEKVESRFRLANKALIKLIQDFHLIQTLYFYQIVTKIIFIDRPDEEEKNTLVYYFGEKGANRFIAGASNLRRKNLKDLTKQELQEKKDYVTGLSNEIRYLAILFGEQNKEILKDEFLRELYLPFSIYDEH